MEDRHPRRRLNSEPHYLAAANFLLQIVSVHPKTLHTLQHGQDAVDHPLPMASKSISGLGYSVHQSIDACPCCVYCLSQLSCPECIELRYMALNKKNKATAQVFGGKFACSDKSLVC